MPEPTENVVATISKNPPSYLVIDRINYASFITDYASFVANPSNLRLSRFVHTLCDTHTCEQLDSTEHWLVMRVR